MDDSIKIINGDSTFDLQSWLTGLALGLAGKPLLFTSAQKEPIACLYGTPSASGNIGMRSSVILPELPDWDENKYPYAYMYFNKDDPSIVGLRVISKELSSNGEFLSCTTSHNHQVYVVQGDKWVQTDTTTSWSECWIEYFIWANIDIELENISFNKSDSIPTTAHVVEYYNGVVMPPLPDEIAAYQYMVLWQDASGSMGVTDYYTLAGLSAKPKTEEVSYGLSGTEIEHGQFEKVQYHQAGAYPDNSDWTIIGSFTGTFYKNLSLVKWANHPVLNLDGSVYLPGTDPIPITKGIVDYINDIPIYE